MRHYVLTRSSYGPDFPIEANRRRLDMLRGICARSLARQTFTDWTWLVLVDPEDPLLREREAVIRSVGRPVIIGHDPNMATAGLADRPQARWGDFIDWGPTVLTTRHDDDDALSPGALAVVRANADRWRGGRVIWSLPAGYRVAAGRANLVYFPQTMFVTLQAPPGDRVTVMERSHRELRAIAPVMVAHRRPAWLWVRHAEARSAAGARSRLGRESMAPITERLRASFDVDWDLIER